MSHLTLKKIFSDSLFGQKLDVTLCHSTKRYYHEEPDHLEWITIPDSERYFYVDLQISGIISTHIYSKYHTMDNSAFRDLYTQFWLENYKYYRFVCLDHIETNHVALRKGSLYSKKIHETRADDVVITGVYPTWPWSEADPNRSEIPNRLNQKESTRFGDAYVRIPPDEAFPFLSTVRDYRGGVQDARLCAQLRNDKNDFDDIPTLPYVYDRQIADMIRIHDESIGRRVFIPLFPWFLHGFITDDRNFLYSTNQYVFSIFWDSINNRPIDPVEIKLSSRAGHMTSRRGFLSFIPDRPGVVFCSLISQSHRDNETIYEILAHKDWKNEPLTLRQNEYDQPHVVYTKRLALADAMEDSSRYTFEFPEIPSSKTLIYRLIQYDPNNVFKLRYIYENNYRFAYVSKYIDANNESEVSNSYKITSGWRPSKYVNNPDYPLVLEVVETNGSYTDLYAANATNFLSGEQLFHVG